MKMMKPALWALLMCTVSMPGVAVAQVSTAVPAVDPEEAFGLDDVIVTAQRREQALQDVPVAVSAVGGEMLAARGVTSLANLNTGTVPGLVIFKSAGLATQLGINIRGVTVSDPGQGTVEQGVPVYIDGVFLGRSQGLGMDLGEPERIEVLRGPQGTLFGRNAEGGAVQIITKKPTGVYGASVAATVGNYDYSRFVAHVDLPSIGGVNIKLSGLISQHGGFVENRAGGPGLTAHENFGLEDSEGWRIAARWNPMASLMVDYSYDWSSTDYTSQYFEHRNRNGARIGGRSVDVGRSEESWIPMWMDRLNTEAAGHNLTFALDLTDGIMLKSITSYRTLVDGGFNQTGGVNSFTAQNDAAVPGHAFRSYGRTGLAAGAFLDQDQVSQEFQLIGSTERLQYTLGAFYYHEEVSDIRVTGATVYYTAPGPSVPVSVDPVIIAQPNVNHAESTSYAAYGQATWTPPILDDRLDLTFGLRFTDDDKVARRTVAGGVALATPLRSNFSTQRWDPAATVQYRLNDDSNVYLRYATGYRAGGVAVRSPTFRPYLEEVATTWELGYKTEIGRTLRFNAALFDNTIEGFQVNTLVDPLVNISLVDTINIPGNYKLRGAELEAEWLPMQNLRISASYAYTDEQDPSYSVGGVPVPLSFPGVPEHTGSFAADLDIPASIGTVVLHVDYQGSSEYYRPATLTALTATSYFPATLDVWNARVTLQDMPSTWGGGIKISAWVKNVFDGDDIVFSSTAGGVTLNDPRTYGLELRARF